MLYRKVKVYGLILFGRSKYFKNTRTDDNRVSVVQRKEKAGKHEASSRCSYEAIVWKF